MADQIRKARAEGAAGGGAITFLGAIVLEALGVWERSMAPADGHQEAYLALVKVTKSCVEMLNAVNPGAIPGG